MQPVGLLYLLLLAVVESVACRSKQQLPSRDYFEYESDEGSGLIPTTIDEPPRPEMLASASSLSSLVTIDDDNGLCPDDCICDRNNNAAAGGAIVSADCQNVADLEDLLSQFGVSLAALAVNSCQGDSWLDSSSNSNDTTAAIVARGRALSLPPRSSLVNFSLNSCALPEADVSRLLDRLMAPQLKSLKISKSGLARLDLALVGRRLGGLEKLDLSDNSLEEVNLVEQAEEKQQQQLKHTRLRHLNLAGNMLATFNLGQLVALFPGLERLNLSGNSLRELTADGSSSTAAQGLALRILDLSRNAQLDLLCNRVLFALPNLERLDLSHTGLRAMPTLVFELKHLKELLLVDTVPVCDCHSAYQLIVRQQQVWSLNSTALDNLECRVPDSAADRRQRMRLDDEEILQVLNCEGAVIQEMSNDTEVLVGSELLLDCSVTGSPPAEVLWLTPRMELIKFVPDLDQEACPPLKQELALSSTLEDYSTWEDHFRVLPNGSLLIDEFGWRDRGVFQCYAENGFGNATDRVDVKLNYHYRNRIYYFSLAFGFGGAACFLGLTLLAKLMHHLLWNYGCCLCCACCKNQLPPKTKQLTEVVDSIETYRIQQLEKLRENYHQQSQRIRENCALQMERVRENYNNQVKSVKEVKNYGSTQCQNVKDNYYEQISKIREYSTGQLDKCHENYLFQRQRLRKFSAQNYLKIRETRAYTQKTLNRVLDNMPALYLDLSSCRQGFGDQDIREWQEEIERKEAEMRQILDIDRQPPLDIGDSQSLYFTPTGTPLRDVAAAGLLRREVGGGGDPYEEVYSSSAGAGSPLSPDHPGMKGKRSHKRGVSSLSNFLPFWWGMNQQETGETVAIVEKTDVITTPTSESFCAAAASESESTNLLQHADAVDKNGDDNNISENNDHADDDILSSKTTPTPTAEEADLNATAAVDGPIQNGKAHGSANGAVDGAGAPRTGPPPPPPSPVPVVSSASGKKMSIAQARAEFFNSTVA